MNGKYLSMDHQKRQQGFVLVLVLVMLAVLTLTLIGVSSMNSSSIELKSVANAKQHSIAFNVVQSAIEYAVSSDPAVTINFQINDETQTQTVNPSVALGSDVSATAQFSGCGVASGNSLSKGFSYNFFDITATGKNAKGTASSTQVQGIRFPAASC